MDRREFIGLTGLAVFAPGVALKAIKRNPQQKLVEVIRNSYKYSLKPITIEGKEYYVMFVHPRTKYMLDVAEAKRKYKHEQWVKRFNRRQERLGLAKYVESKPEIGTFDGIRIVETQPIETTAMAS